MSCKSNCNEDQVTDNLSQCKFSRNKATYSCEVLIEHKSLLCPPPKRNTKVLHMNTAEAQIEKICTGKIIIGGTLHKTIVYTDVAQCIDNSPNIIKQRDIPFSCYVDIPSANSEDKYSISDTSVICAFSQVITENNCCCSEMILVAKDIVKITVQRVSASGECKKIRKCKFWGKQIINSEICFVQPINPEEAYVSINADSTNFKVKLAGCDLVVVSGFITKIVAFTDGTPTAKKTIPVKVEIPVDPDDCDEIGKGKWKVTKVKLCDECSDFTCPSENPRLFHKLVEKDLIAVQVKRC